MRKIARIAGAAVILTMFQPVIAAETSSTEQGAVAYDWQTCIDTKTNECVNTTCVTSDNINCKEDCENMAKDKCITEGVSQPPDEPDLKL